MISASLAVFGLLALAAAEAYTPPMVEIPPVDERQMNPSRDSVYNRDRQLSYSYGTTAYHYNQGQSGYASAHVTNPQNGGGQGPTALPDRRAECQNPMLRVFFRDCHAPGTAPQSPVQCQPIPGQTTFRCLIKQQSWPTVRITQCPPGTAASSGECVRVPAGSFSTNGIAVVPVVMPGQTRIIQSYTSSVYRHCSNGACKTCIGDQCSTTGIQTPVSVDHRGRANASTEVVAFGDAGRDVKQKCARNICKTCIDRICYDRSYPLLRVTAGCPPAVCDCANGEFVYWTDQCPICRCPGFASREPCRSQNECPAGASCRNHVCLYAELPNSHFDKVCTFSSQCTRDQMCYNWRCGAKTAQSRHLEDHSCAMDQDCPASYTCADMTCWEGEASRLKGQSCLLDHQCPTGYFCTNGLCTDNYHHGSFGAFAPSAPTIPPTTDRQCEYDQQCHGGETCWERRCVTYDERRRIDEARRRQQIDHQNWAPTTTTTTTRAPERADQQQGHVSTDEEYQRRLAEYNRQIAEQERQYEERRRQAEEDRRRQEETEQRRRQESEADQRHRQESEADQRRRQEQDADQRHQESETDQRHSQESETDQRRRQESEADQRRRQQEEEQRHRQEQEADERRRQEQELERQRQAEEAEQRQRQEAEQRQRQQQEAEQRRQQQLAEQQRRQQEEENQRRLREQEAQRQAETERQNRLLEEQRAREEENRRRQAQESEETPQHHVEPTPDTEVGEEMTDDGGHDGPGGHDGHDGHDDENEYERRMQEYNRQLRERQRQLQEDDQEIADHEQSYPSTTMDPMLLHGEVEVHDGDNDDFYGRTRQRTPAGQDETTDQSVASYRIRYHRVRRRQ